MRDHLSRKLLGALSLVGLCALPACNSNANGRAGRTLRVPQDHTTIQSAIEAAKPGDLVLVGPGTYHEKVIISKPRITLRGTDRNTVILDGKYQFANGVEVTVDGVTVENLTVHSYNGNGVIINGINPVGGVNPQVVYGSGENAIKGYRVSYVTAYNNGLYGIYAFASRGGRIEHSYVSGHPDSGIYVGQCKPCNVVLTDNIAENNAIGYYGTNASGKVFVINSAFRNNRLGLTPNTQVLEKLQPQVETVIAGNVVADNGNVKAPKNPKGAIGNGVVIGGGTKNSVLKNRISGNPAAGVFITDLDGFAASDNRIEGNVLERNGIDLWYGPVKPVAAGNCFVGNKYTSSAPDGIEAVLTCGAAPTTAVSLSSARQPTDDRDVDFKTVAAPPAQPSMPNSETAAVSSPTDVEPTIDLSTIVVPA
jgi:parallel beta-helix repeat protein